MSGCDYSNAPPSEWTGSVDTIRGGAIITTNHATGAWGDSAHWALVSDLRLGAREGSAPTVFGVIRSLDVDRAGRIYVLDGQANEVRVFSPTGEFVFGVGRSGSGPGEFQHPAAVRVMQSGEFWVADPRANRYTLFDSTGAVLQTVAPGINPANWYLVFPWHGTIDTTGRVYDYTTTAEGVRLIRFDKDNPAIDTFPVPDRTRPEMHLVDAAGELRASMPLPFAPEIVRYIDRSGNLWIGANEEFQITKRHVDGDTIRIIKKDHHPLPVTPEEGDSALAPAEGILRNGGRIAGPGVPETKPAYRWFVTDDRSYLWVFPYSPLPEEGKVMLVFDPDGRYLGRVRADFVIDSEVPPVIRSNWFYTVVRDELDVQYVLRARITDR